MIVRWVVNVVSGACLAAVLAVMLLAVRSYRDGDEFTWRDHLSRHILKSWRGRIMYQVDQDWPDIRGTGDGELEPTYRYAGWGFEITAGREGRIHGDFFSSTYCRRWIVPYWFLLLSSGFGTLPLLVRARRTMRRRARRRRGLCVGCGYDLRATRGRCPECGVESDGGDVKPGMDR